METRIISIWEPWASMIANGKKTIETRTWSTSFRGRLVIASAKQNDRYTKQATQDYQNWPKKWGGPLLPSDFQPVYGRILAIAELVDVRPLRQTDFREAAYDPEWDVSGKYAFVLENIVKVPKPPKVKGKQRLAKFDLEEYLDGYLET